MSHPLPPLSPFDGAHLYSMAMVLYRGKMNFKEEEKIRQRILSWFLFIIYL